ncbi:hypothetical protein ACJMK2_005152 [Sinanodonta woodiana]|uniref:Uncharacterized protein n=1 Tax=Sinanodonta woodiana TaxID=1069815 RepID=A0ABD3VSM2_SINWO
MSQMYISSTFRHKTFTPDFSIREGAASTGQMTMSSPQSVITRCIFLSLICIPLLLPSASSREIGPPSPRCIDVHGKCLPRLVPRPDLPNISKRIQMCDKEVLICHNQRCGCIRNNFSENIYL